MKLARKLTFALVLGVLGVLALHAYIRVMREISFFDNDMQRDARVMGRILGAAMAEVWLSDSPERGLRLIENVNEREGGIHIGWIPLDGPAADPRKPTLSPEDLKRLAAGEVVSHHVQLDGKGEHLATLVPVTIDARHRGVLAFAESRAAEQDYINRTIRNTVAVTLIMGLVCGFVAIVLGMWLVGRPMQHLIEQARRVGAGDLSKRITLRQRDEIGELAREMNLMCDHLSEANDRIAQETHARIAAIEQLRHADRLATVGKLASGIAHELGAPLQVVSGRARMLAHGDVPPDEIPGDARIILEQSQRMTKIIRQLLDFARRRGPEKAALDLRPILQQTCAMLDPMAKKRSARVTIEPGGEAVVAPVDPEQIQQALTNLVLNGIQAVKQGGEVRAALRIERIRPPADHGGTEAEYACIEVQDNGVGMPSDVKEHIFEPFFTTKDVGEGTGLGLSVTYGIVRDHSGWIDVRSEPGAGSRFSVYLPLE